MESLVDVTGGGDWSDYLMQYALAEQSFRQNLKMAQLSKTDTAATPGTNGQRVTGGLSASWLPMLAVAGGVLVLVLLLKR